MLDIFLLDDFNIVYDSARLHRMCQRPSSALTFSPQGWPPLRKVLGLPCCALPLRFKHECT